MDLTGEVAEAMLLALQRMPLYRFGSWAGGHPSITVKDKINVKQQQ